MQLQMFVNNESKLAFQDETDQYVEHVARYAGGIKAGNGEVLALARTADQSRIGDPQLEKDHHVGSLLRSPDKC